MRRRKVERAAAADRGRYYCFSGYNVPQAALAADHVVRPQEVVVSDSRRHAVALLRTELAEEAASGFTRLRHIPQTDIIWFLDYFSNLTGAEREALLDALAESAAAAFALRRPAAIAQRQLEMLPVAPPLAQMLEARNRPGGKGGTRYTDVKMLCGDPSLREPSYYHSSWRENLTALHFQPRPDLLPDLDHLKAAKAPLVRKLVNAALTQSLHLRKEKLPGGVSKCTGRYGEYEITVRVDFGGMLSQLGYTVTLKDPGDQSLVFVQLDYELLWGTGGRWDYLTEENAPRSIAFFAEQIAYLVNLAGRLNGRKSGGERDRDGDGDEGPSVLSFRPKGE
jgi:hypothetical protein